MSTSIAQWSGTLFERVAADDPAEVDRRPVEQLGRLARERQRLDLRGRRRSPSAPRCRPSHGVEPCAARAAHLDAHREHALGLDADVQVGRLAGDREVADVALLDEVVGAALRRPPPTPRRQTQTKWTRTRVLRGQVARWRTSSPRGRPSCRRRRGRRGGRRRRAARTARAGRAPRRGGRGGRPSGASAAPTVAASTGRPLCMAPFTSTSRASSQPLTKPAALCMPSRVEVS